jgi:fructose/tagatose bisphosphate aldolase
MTTSSDFTRALDIGRPPNVKRMFPNSKALIVSGKAVDRAMLHKGRAMTIAANGRNESVIRGALNAAQRANAAIIIEIAKSESTYCAVNMWNIARITDQIMNELGITVPVAIHADHFGIKKAADREQAKVWIPSLFDHGITSIAIDASHMPDDENLLTSLELHDLVPSWAGYETEVGEIKGKAGLTNKEEALFLIQGLNAHGIFPDWIAMNNGTTHGIEASEAGIDVELTADIHQALDPYGVSGAQHGTSGNSSERLRRIAQETRTTKANVATALQMLSWGIKVNDYGNAIVDQAGNFAKIEGAGVTEDLWEEMLAHAKEKDLSGGNFKKLNLPFQSAMNAQPLEVRERMAKAVEDFTHRLLTEVFNAADTAPLAIQALLDAGSHELPAKAERLEDPDKWTEEHIRANAPMGDKGPEGDFDD